MVEHSSQSPIRSNGGHATDKNLSYLDPDVHPDEALRRIKTSGAISLSPELFEKLYLSPQNSVKGQLRKTFGNPTPMYVADVCEGRKMDINPM